MGGGVRGILLDSSVLLAADDDEYGNASLVPGADSLLRKLHYSKIPTGISYGLGLSAAKVNLLERISRLYSLDRFILNLSSIDDMLQKVALAWGSNGGNPLYVVSDHNDNLFLELSNWGWMIIILRSLGQGAASGLSPGGTTSMLFIDKLEELPLTICYLNRKASGKDNVCVGYIMKPSREEFFDKRGAFPLCPTQNGLIFMPLTFELPMSLQLQEVDVVLHKATDEIVSVEMISSSEFFDNITYTMGMQELQRYIVHHPDCCVIDPFDNIYPVLDRLKIQHILLGLGSLKKEGRCTIRGPHFLKVDHFSEPNLLERLAEAKLSLPSIVKPQVACGVAISHSMVIVFRDDDYRDLSVPLPAVVQEYVDHSSTLFKFYVLGEKVFHAVKKSMPNADALTLLTEKDGFKPLYFDSLKSLPIAEENRHVGDHQRIDLELVIDAASWLRRMLDLTIFGFDVVIQEGTGDHVIVDVNYLPSFNEVPDNIAIPAFWEAIKRKFESRKPKSIQ